MLIGGFFLAVLLYIFGTALEKWERRETPGERRYRKYREWMNEQDKLGK